MADDLLRALPPQQVAAWYRRLAEGWIAATPELKPPLAGVFLRAWLDNRDSKAVIAFDAPVHLKASAAVREVQAYHRDVFLTNQKAKVGSGREKWVGILPRIQAAPGFTKWDLTGELDLEYESLCDPAPNLIAIARVQKLGSAGDRDIFGSLRGFQLKSRVVVVSKGQLRNQVSVQFKRWFCSGTDRYDWNYSEYLTVANPDYQSKEKDAVAPNEQTITVFHSNAKRLEDASLAAPYNVNLRPWEVLDQSLLKTALVDTSRRL